MGYKLTHPALVPDVVELALRRLADALRAPELQADARVRERHRSDRHEVRQYHEHHVVSAHTTREPLVQCPSVDLMSGDKVFV